MQVDIKWKTHTHLREINLKVTKNVVLNKIKWDTNHLHGISKFEC